MTKTEAIKLLKEDKALYETDCCHAGDGSPDGDLLEALDMAIEALEQEPIIHCKDCKYAKPFLDRYHCKQLDEDWEINFGAEHYCSFAERMESDEQ